jgi:hypothetical protein
MDMHLRLLLGGSLLALVMSGCATLVQDPVSQNDQIIAYYEPALAYPLNRVEKGIVLVRLGLAYLGRGQVLLHAGQGDLACRA